MIQRIKNSIDRLRDDPHMQEVARGTVLAFALKVLGSGVGFSLNIVIARLLGADGAGLYFLSLAVMTVSSVIGRVGLDNALLRFVATNAARNNWETVNGVYRVGILLAVIASSVVTVAIFVMAPWMAEVFFHKPDLAEPLRWMSLSILPFALLNLQAESLKALKKLRIAMLIQSLGVPLVSLFLIVPLSNIAGVTGAVWAYVIAASLNAFLGLWSWRNAMKMYAGEVKTFPLKMLWESSMPLFLVAILNNGVRNWVPLLVVGIWVSSQEVGVFAVELRVVALTTMMLFTLNNVLAPKIAELYANDDMVALASTARRAATILFLLSSPVFLILILSPDFVMSLFGDEFVEGSLGLAILAAGQIVNVFAGTLGTILIVSGNEPYIKNMTLIFTGLMLIMLFTLVPVMGSLGAAISVAISGTGLSLVTVKQAEKIIGMSVVPNFAHAVTKRFVKE